MRKKMRSKELLDKFNSIESNYNLHMDKAIMKDLFKKTFNLSNMSKDCLRLCHVLCHKEISYRHPRYDKKVILDRHTTISKLLNIDEKDL